MLVLSIDVGARHLRFVVYRANTRDIEQFGTCDLPAKSSSYIPALYQLWQLVRAPSVTHVVVERLEGQLRSRHVQAGRLEANMEGFFSALGSPVTLLPTSQKHSSHGLRVDAETAARIADLEATVKSKATLSKKAAAELAKMFLDQNKQCHSITTSFSKAVQRQGMAETLLQAFAFCNTKLGKLPHGNGLIA